VSRFFYTSAPDHRSSRSAISMRYSFAIAFAGDSSSRGFADHDRLSRFMRPSLQSFSMISHESSNHAMERTADRRVPHF
jgi:hypothetical protein